MFVDFKKAFAKVIREQLWYRMEQMGVFGKNINVIIDINNCTKTRTKFNGTLSDYIANIIIVTLSKSSTILTIHYCQLL
jgi:hypothetical protein